MCDQMGLHATVGEIHHVKPRRARGKREVSDTDKVSGADAVLVPLKRVKRAAKQTGSYFAIYPFATPESRPRACGRRGQAGE